MCGLFPSLLMDCVDVWLDGLADGISRSVAASSSSLACVCVGCVNGYGNCGSRLNVRLSLADIQCEWLAGRFESTIGSLDAGR